MSTFLRQIRPAVVAVLAFTVLCGLAYPLLMTGVGSVAFSDKVDGQLVERNGKVVGSKLIGQNFAAPQYFHPRPSSAGAGYDSAGSSGSNAGPDNPDYLKTVEQRVARYRTENDLGDDVLVPADAVTGSGSGLDPLISTANADLQARRVAKARGMSVARVRTLIDAHTESRPLGMLGDPGVNVLELNLALDRS